MVNIVHPCRVKSFRKAVSTVMDNLVMDSVIIENLNIIVKVVAKRMKGCFLEDDEGVTLVDRFN